MMLDRITTDPQVLNGRPCIRGLRFTVSRLLGLLARGETKESILKEYPYLEEEDINQALTYAARLADYDEIEVQKPKVWVNFLIDVNLSPNLTGFFDKIGHSSQHAFDIGLGTATDEQILSHARENNMIIVTADMDFSRILALTKSGSPGVILFRGGQYNESDVRSLLTSLFESVDTEDIPTSLIVIDKNKIRKRKLPITWFYAASAKGYENDDNPATTKQTMNKHKSKTIQEKAKRSERSDVITEDQKRVLSSLAELIQNVVDEAVSINNKQLTRARAKYCHKLQ